MDEELKRALALDDKARADAERDDWHRAWQAKRAAAPAGVDDVDAWLAARAKPKPAPQPQRQQPQHTVTLDAATQKLWNSWCDRRILEFVDGPLFNAIAEAFSIFRGKERQHMREHVANEIKKQLDVEATKLREEIAGLRIGTVVGRSVLRGEINDLMKTKTKART